MIEPCKPWTTPAEQEPSCRDQAIRPDTWEAACSLASTVLFNLTSRRWPGECSDVMHPLCNPCAVYSCQGSTTLYLPAVGVREIIEVVVGGVTLDPSAYALYDSRTLVRRDGHGWPCQHSPWGLGALEFSVSYKWGQEPPFTMKLAARLLAHQYALALTPEKAGECKLSPETLSVTRGGVSKTYESIGTLIREGRVGHRVVDNLVASVRAGEARTSSVVVPGKWPQGTRPNV